MPRSSLSAVKIKPEPSPAERVQPFNKPLSRWQLPASHSLRHEAHFESRVLRCFARRPLGLAAMLNRAAEYYPQVEALVDGQRRWTWQQLFATCNQVAGGLQQLGVQQGDRVALLLGNQAEFVLALYAIAIMGGVAVPISTRDSAKGIEFALNQCGACAAIAQADMLQRVPPQLANGAPILQVICGSAPVDCAADKSVRWEQLLTKADASHAVHAVHASFNEESPAIILYTSGTTGQPKGAVITHFNLSHSALHLQVTLNLQAGERAMLAVPGSHVTGLIAIVATMGAVAGCVVVLQEFKAAAFLHLAARERMSYTLMVPAMYALCLREPTLASFDLSAWRLGGFGGSPMPVSTIAQLALHCPTVQLFNAYGATETTSPATLSPLGSDSLDAVGVALPCADIRIMDDDGLEVPIGQSGEVWIGGPMVVPYYWNNPQATAASFCGGYWKSGDIGTLDASGFLRVHDRKKDMINRGGYKVFSVEVENCLVAHPSVVEAAAVGMPCPVLGERVRVFVYLAEGSVGDEALAQVLKALCRHDLADYKVPDVISFSLTPLPRNANGKLIKRALRERAL